MAGEGRYPLNIATIAEQVEFDPPSLVLACPMVFAASLKGLIMPFWFRYYFTIASSESDKNQQEAQEEVEKYLKEKYPDLVCTLRDVTYVRRTIIPQGTDN